MENHIYFNFFTIGALIPVVLHILITLFFFSIPEKSRATFHLGFAYLFTTLLNFAYLIASSYYHPLAAYHRWLTVGVIMLGQTHFTLFIYNYPKPGNPKIERILWFSQYIVSFAITAAFVLITRHASAVYHFEGHYWDFDADEISKWIGVILVLYLVPFTTIYISKMISTSKRERLVVTLLGIAYLVGALIPSIANALSREGIIDRHFFQITWAMLNIFGFFLLAIIYINNTRDKSSFMAKIVGISMVTFLVLIQGISYFSLRDKDRAYDEIRGHQIHRILFSPDYRPNDLCYMAVYDPGSGTMEAPYLRDGHPLDRQRIRRDMENTLLAERVADAHGTALLLEVLHEARERTDHLKGYIRSLDAFILQHGQIIPDRDQVWKHLVQLNFYAAYYHRKIHNMPEEGFREKLEAFLDSRKAGLPYFNAVLREHLQAGASLRETLKSDVLAYVKPMKPSGNRLYRDFSVNPRHTVSFMHYDKGENRIYELGFAYTAYRDYIHPAAANLIIMLFGVLLFVLAGFRLFFLGTFILPLRHLLGAVKKVNRGDLNVVVPVHAGDEIGYLSETFNHMVSSVKTSRNELNNIRLYLKNIIDSMPSALIGVDPDGRVTHWNKEARRMTRLEADHVEGVAIDKIVPQFSEYLDHLRTAIRNRTPRTIEKVPYERRGKTRYTDIVIYPLIDNGVQGAVIRVDDITDRVRFEEMVVQSEKMASVGGLAAGMAHEINNPLGGIMMGAQNIQRRLSKNLGKNYEVAAQVGTSMDAVFAYMEKRGIYKMLSGILEMGHRASLIVSNMLNFSRKSDSRVSSATVNELVDSTIELAASDYNLKKHYDFRHIQIIRDYDNTLPQINCIRTEIQQVILNLLKNAAQAVAGKSYDKEQPRIRIRTRLKDGMASIEIEDNGPGIDEKIRKRIFEPFFTTKEVGAGTGLGLSVSYFIITNNHGGKMELATRSGKGSRFTIKLPTTRQGD